MAVEEKADLESPLEKAKEYFKKMGLNPSVAKNDFTPADAIAIFTKAVQDLEDNKLAEDTIKAVLNRAWDLFKILA